MKQVFFRPSAMTRQSDEARAFGKAGFVKLDGLVSGQTLSALDRAVSLSISEERDLVGGHMARHSYHGLERDEAVLHLVQQVHARIRSIVPGSMFFIQALGFEIRKNVDTGFPWHVGRSSFSYIHEEDFACSLWIPLMPIEPEEQHGGMAYVSREDLCGRFMYQLFMANAKRQLGAIESGEQTVQEALRRYRSIADMESLTELFEFYKREDRFQPVDALLFDKYVIHRSAMLREGPMPSRRALVLRFIDRRSTFDARRARLFLAGAQAVGLTSSNKLADRLGLHDGVPIVTSSTVRDLHPAHAFHQEAN